MQIRAIDARLQHHGHQADKVGIIKLAMIPRENLGVWRCDSLFDEALGIALAATGLKSNDLRDNRYVTM